MPQLLEMLDQNLSALVSGQSPLTEAEILTKLRQTYQISNLVTATQQDKLIVAVCEKLEIIVSDTELQTSGDRFRLSRQLTSARTMLEWLDRQMIGVEDWTEGLRLQLLTQKLKEALFGGQVDAHYLQNRDYFRRIALSQILVSDSTIAQKVFSQLKREPQRFCELALEHSQAKISSQQGGFVGIRFVSELMPEVADAIADIGGGNLIEPFQSRLGFHILKIEKWFPVQLTEEVRETIIETLFQSWLQQIINSAGSGLNLSMLTSNNGVEATV